MSSFHFIDDNTEPLASAHSEEGADPGSEPSRLWSNFQGTAGSMPVDLGHVGSDRPPAASSGLRAAGGGTRPQAPDGGDLKERVGTSENILCLQHDFLLR